MEIIKRNVYFYYWHLFWYWGRPKKGSKNVFCTTTSTFFHIFSVMFFSLFLKDYFIRIINWFSINCLRTIIFERFFIKDNLRIIWFVKSNFVIVRQRGLFYPVTYLLINKITIDRTQKAKRSPGNYLSFDINLI
jgi:hypothetical protein